MASRFPRQRTIIKNCPLEKAGETITAVFVVATKVESERLLVLLQVLPEQELVEQIAEPVLLVEQAVGSIEVPQPQVLVVELELLEHIVEPVPEQGEHKQQPEEVAVPIVAEPLLEVVLQELAEVHNHQQALPLEHFQLPCSP
jgi:uncharacterized protein (DUF1697 family)